MPEKKRILFVDDEPSLLQALQRMLRPMRHEWELAFAANGNEALEILSESCFEVVVADMRMPGMDGTELLYEVMKRYPNTVRIIFSGSADQEMIMKSIGPTHQFLAKPYDAKKLKAKLDSIFRFRAMLSDEALRVVVSKMKILPSLPTLYFELMKVLKSADGTMKKAGEVMSKDVGMTAKILQLANSAFFGLAVHVSDPIHAARLLGPEILKALVLSVQIFAKFDAIKCKGLSLEKLSDHCLAVGALAKRIAVSQDLDRKVADNTLIAGVLHDTGKLVLAQNIPEKYEETLLFARENDITVWQAEQESIGATHAEIGAYLLGLWGLSETIVEAVLFHHCPGKSVNKNFSPLSAIHIANTLMHEQDSENNRSLQSSFDFDYLDKLDLTDQLAKWRDICLEFKKHEVGDEQKDPFS